MSCCTLEVDCAKKNGYILTKIYEVWHYPEKPSKYDRASGTEGIFEKYVNHALKMKQEASGYPENCTTDEQKQAYLTEYELHEGIILDADKIDKNPGRRQVAKLMANSLWGYLGMNTNKRMFKIIYHDSEWQKLIQDNRYIIHDFFETEQSIQVVYSELKDFHFGALTTNVILASFVTCHARLTLLSELHKLNHRVLYFDTDSIFFISKDGEYEPKLGNYLGQFTNELDKSEGEYIDEFVSAGAKNYAYKTDKGFSECTVKGITFNRMANLAINFDSIKDIVCCDQNKTIKVPQHKFFRDRDHWHVTTGIQDKQYRFVYDKRVVLEDLTTLPYGY